MTRPTRLQFPTWLLAAAVTFLAPLTATVAPGAEKTGLVLKKGDRIILIGNTLAERMQYYSHFETLLHSRFPDLELVFHNLGYSADELKLRPRQAHFNDHGHTLEDEKPDVLIAVFGFNESFAGPRASASSRTTWRTSSRRRPRPSTTARPPPGWSCCRRSRTKTSKIRISPTARKTTKTSSSTPTPWPSWPASTAWSSSICLHPARSCTRQQRPADDQRHPFERRRLPATGPDTRRGAVWAEARLSPGGLEGTSCRRSGKESPVLLRLSGRQRLLHLRRPQSAIRHHQLPGRVRQAPRDDPEPRSSASGTSPREEASRRRSTTATPADSSRS